MLQVVNFVGSATYIMYYSYYYLCPSKTSYTHLEDYAV